MESWTITSRPAIQRFFSLTIATVGGLLMWGSHRPPNASAAALWLGIVLVVVGGASALLAGRETITIDPHAETITIETTNHSGRSARVVAFTQIENIVLNRVGSSSSGVVFYSLTLELRGDTPVTLFAPGRFYAGCMNRATVDGWRDRLWGAIGRGQDPHPVA